MNSFHSDKTPWAKIKHGVLGNYLPLFVSKTRLFQKPVYLVDGFAGPGAYDDGQAGSALMSANIASNPVTRSNQGVLRCINVEKKPSCFAKLERATEEHVRLGIVENLHGEFEKKLPEILEKIDGDTALFFIDPFGTAGARASTLKLISERNGVTEALIRFDDTRVKRLVSFNKNDLAGLNTRAVKTAEKFLERAYQLTGEQGVMATIFKNPEAGRIIVEDYIRLVVEDLQLFKFGIAYPVVNPATKGHRYYLAHFCNHEDGYTYVANFMAKVQRTVERVTSRKNELELFGGNDEQAELMGFRDDLIRLHEQEKVDAIFRELPRILKQIAMHKRVVQRRVIYAMIVDHFKWSVMLKESKKALLAAQKAGLVLLDGDAESSEVRILGVSL